MGVVSIICDECGESFHKIAATEEEGDSPDHPYRHHKCPAALIYTKEELQERALKRIAEDHLKYDEEGERL